jgi:hypothetical protein
MTWKAAALECDQIGGGQTRARNLRLTCAVVLAPRQREALERCGDAGTRPGRRARRARRTGRSRAHTVVIVVVAAAVVVIVVAGAATVTVVIAAAAVIVVAAASAGIVVIVASAAVIVVVVRRGPTMAGGRGSNAWAPTRLRCRTSD